MIGIPVRDPAAIIGKSGPSRSRSVAVTTASSIGLKLDYTQYLLAESYEGIHWIYGHHDASTVDGQALLAGYKLWRSSLETP